MKKNPKTEKIFFAAAAVLSVLLIAALIFMMAGNRRGPEPEAEPSPSPSPEATEAPGLMIAGTPAAADADTFYLRGASLSPEDIEALCSLQSLRTLSLLRCELSDISFLRRLPGLTTLYLSDNRISDLSPLGELSNLRTLYLDNNPLGELNALTALTNLRTLSLKGVAVADYALEDLRAAMPDCRIFDDSAVDSVRPLSLGGVDFMADVLTLDLSGRGISDISRLSYCTQIEKLLLAGNPLEGIGVLRELPTLRVLDLSGTNLDDSDLNVILGLRNLSWLEIRNNSAITAEKLDELKKALPNCEIVHDEVFYKVNLGGEELQSDAVTLALAQRGITDLKPLEHFERLEHADLSMNAITDLRPLGKNVHMKTLNLENNNISDLTPLYGFTELEELDLSGNAILDITALAGCSSLRRLDLSGNQLNYISHLALCSQLEWLDLRNNLDITWDMVEYLRLILPACEILTDVQPPETLPPLPTEPPLNPDPMAPPEPLPPLNPDPVAPTA